MAQVVAAMALTHSPGLTGWFDRAPEDQRREARRALDVMRDRLRAARPDVILLLSNDHLLNWPINNTPEYTVGIGAEHVGPADWYDEWLALEKYRIPGHPGLARYLGVDITLVRLIALILVFVPPFPAVIAYIVAWIVMPNDPLPSVAYQQTATQA